MILAAFTSMIAWATASLPVDVPSSPSHPGRGGPEAREGWGAAERRDSLDEPAVADEPEDVHQGFTGATELVASYAWDGRDRVSRYEDGAGNGYGYAFDGAGRVRTVSRRPDGLSAWSTWYRFDWLGPDPWHQYEGSAVL